MPRFRRVVLAVPVPKLVEWLAGGLVGGLALGLVTGVAAGAGSGLGGHGRQRGGRQSSPCRGALDRRDPRPHDRGRQSARDEERCPLADILAAAVTIEALEDRGLYGHARRALLEIASATTGDRRVSASLLARSIAPDEGTAEGDEADAKLGVVSNLAILGPFRDTGEVSTHVTAREAKGRRSPIWRRATPGGPSRSRGALCLRTTPRRGAFRSIC